MKNFSLLILALMVLFASCQKKSEDTTPQLTKVADYLYEITVDEYSDTIPNGMIGAATADFACSAVRNGNYYGRNLDFFISEVAEIVLHTPAREGRHASVGVSRLFQYTGEQLEAGLKPEEVGLIPWSMFDGINDAGLFCNMNVVPCSDGGLANTGTNPGKPDVYSVFLIRALLDNCATVEEAIAYINGHNLMSQPMGGFNLHFMIGDPNSNIVLEFIDNKAVITEQNIMTNFYVSLLPEYTPHADGIERYNILKEHFDEGGESMQGMWNLLRRVRYSQAYDPETKPFWRSEFSTDVPLDAPLDSVFAHPGIQRDMHNFQHYMETGEYTPEMHLWYTEHNSTYDIAGRKLWVTIHEDYDHHYEFEL